jgi:hypothetical protein
LDSGAYAAWSRQVDLPIKDYIRFCKRHKGRLFAYVCMDVIPGKFKQARQHQDFIDSARNSYDNMHRMLDAGLRPIPVIHQGEDIDWLHKYIEEGIDYIGISMSKDPFAEHESWLRHVFSEVCDDKGRPRVKLHGFGITTPSILTRYPFYTVDSTGWLLTPAYGHIIIPERNLDGTFNFHKQPSRSVHSSVDHVTKGHNAINYDIVGKHREAAVDRYVAETLGCTQQELRYDSTTRRRAVVKYYELLCKAIHPVRFGEFYPRYMHPEFGPGKDQHLHVIYVLSWQPMMTDALCAEKAHYHLLSYAEIKDRKEVDFIHYIETGKMRTRAVAKRKANWKDPYYRATRFLSMHRRSYDRGVQSE